MPLVLVIEDNESNMKLASVVLASARMEVLGARSAAEGIALARACQPQLILMDIQLPRMDGFEATRILKRDPATAHIPIIAVTAHAMPEDATRMREAGCDGYLPKPYRRAQLLGAIAKVLPSRPRTTVER